MAGPTPEQMLALNAMLQQGTQPAPAVSIPVTVQTASLGIDPAALARPLVIEGTALAVGLDQLLMKTAVGEVLLKVQQLQEQQLLNLLPSRVTLQLRPGPDGLQAVLVVGNRSVMPEKAPDSLSAGTALSRAHTMQPEVPKISQIHQALVLPSSLFSSQTPEQFLASLNAHVQAKQAGFAQVTTTQQQNFFSGILERLGFTAQGEAAKAAINLASAPAPRMNASMTSSAAMLPQMPQPTSIKILGLISPDELKNRALSPVPLDDGVEIAVVRGNTPSGQPVLSVGDKLVAVQGAKNWPVGMELKVSMGPQAGLVVNPGAEDLDLQMWSGLREALAAVAAQSAAVVAEFARLRLPQPSPAQLPGALLFLLAALQKGAPAFLGEEFMKKLKDMGREELIKKIQDQWGKHMGREAEGPGGEWRGVSVPFFDQEKMQALRLYIYNPPGQREKKKKDDPNWARRFLVDMNLSRLGPVQFDGLVHHRRLEVVIRTDRPLPQDLRSDLIARYQRTLEEVRYTGNLLFTANRTGWVAVTPTSDEHVLKNV